MPLTSNLNVTYPSSTDYVANGATAMGTIATGIDAFFGAFTAYSPTLTNVSGGSATGRFVKIGKLGLFRASVTAGTATANGTITVSLPSGWNIETSFAQVVDGTNSNTTVAVITTTNSDRVTVYKDGDQTNFTAGNTVAAVRLQGWVELA